MRRWRGSRSWTACSTRARSCSQTMHDARAREAERAIGAGQPAVRFTGCRSPSRMRSGSAASPPRSGAARWRTSDPRRTRCGPEAPPSRGDRRREDDELRAALERVHRDRALRGDTQPVGHAADAGRVERGVGGRRFIGNGPARARHRCRRLDQDPGARSAGSSGSSRRTASSPARRRSRRCGPSTSSARWPDPSPMLASVST